MDIDTASCWFLDIPYTCCTLINTPQPKPGELTLVWNCFFPHEIFSASADLRVHSGLSSSAGLCLSPGEQLWSHHSSEPNSSCSVSTAPKSLPTPSIMERLNSKLYITAEMSQLHSICLPIQTRRHTGFSLVCSWHLRWLVIISLVSFLDSKQKNSLLWPWLN